VTDQPELTGSQLKQLRDLAEWGVCKVQFLWDFQELGLASPGGHLTKKGREVLDAADATKKETT
jgi:hypothetical protein